jgi:hypothetical protein
MPKGAVAADPHQDTQQTTVRAIQCSRPVLRSAEQLISGPHCPLGTPELFRASGPPCQPQAAAVPSCIQASRTSSALHPDSSSRSASGHRRVGRCRRSCLPARCPTSHDTTSSPSSGTQCADILSLRMAEFLNADQPEQAAEQTESCCWGSQILLAAFAVRANGFTRLSH